MRVAVIFSILVMSAGGAAASALPSPAASGACLEPGQLWQAAPPRASANGIGAAAPVDIGVPVRLRLHPETAIAYPSRPDRAKVPASFGGLASFTVNRAGAYSVGVDQSAWIDVVHEGRAMETTGHGHGPDCSSIAKQVSYILESGSYILELSGSADEDVGVVIRRMP